jgi:anti-anti-sigma regulatory factor
MYERGRRHGTRAVRGFDGYGIFLDAMQTLRMRGGRVHLTCCSPSVKRMISVARLHRVFAIYDSVEEVRELLSRPTNPS